MRAKRATILASLLVSLITTGWLGAEALSSEESPQTIIAGESRPDPMGAPRLGSDAETNTGVETHSASIGGWFLWLGAVVAFSVFLVSGVLFRGEVRSVKQQTRAREDRLSYYKDLRRYKQQMQGPPRDNT